MKLRIQVIHESLEDTDKVLMEKDHVQGPETNDERQRVVKSLEELAIIGVNQHLRDAPEFHDKPDCILVHGSQIDDITNAQEYCLRSGFGTRLILFGGTATLSAKGDYGYSVPETTFVRNAFGFFAEWSKRGEFPGWSFLVGEPELEYSLQILHGVLPRLYGESEENLSNQWRALEQLKERYGQGLEDDNVNRTWLKAKEAYDRFLSLTQIEEMMAALKELRDALLGESPEDGAVGIAEILAELRKSKT
jgi:hypothetical protein